MRIVDEIAHPACKITIFSWNMKYLVKLERGFIEQTFKVPETEVAGDDDIKEMLTEEFMGEAIRRFDEMEASLMRTLNAL